MLNRNSVEKKKHTRLNVFVVCVGGNPGLVWPWRVEPWADGESEQQDTGNQQFCSSSNFHFPHSRNQGFILAQLSVRVLLTPVE